MGYVRHDALLVTGSDFNGHVRQARAKAAAIYAAATEPLLPEGIASLISPVLHGVMNGYESFFIAPDGSKERWSTSDLSDKARADFIAWLETCGLFLDWVAVSFGGDEPAYACIETHNGAATSEEEP